jgi:hypothetical protein
MQSARYVTVSVSVFATTPHKKTPFCICSRYFLGPLKPVVNLFGTCLEPVWSLFGACLEPVWNLFGACLGPVWDLFGTCLDLFLKQQQGYDAERYISGSYLLSHIWNLFGACLEPVWNLFGTCLEPVWTCF